MPLTRNRRGGVGIRGVIAGGLLGAAGVAPDVEAPTVPANLAATNITATTLDLSWDPSTDNVGVVSYEVEQAVGAGAFAWLATVAHPTVTLAVSGLTENTEYRFRVRAIDAAGNMSAWGPSDAGLSATTAWAFVAPSFSESQSGIFPNGDGTGYFVTGPGSATYTVTDSGGAKTARGLVQLSAAGLVNAGFLPQFNGLVNYAAVDAVNRWLYVVGEFTLVGATTRTGICRFNLDTLTLDTWNPGSTAALVWCGLDLNNDLVVAGSGASMTVGGLVRARIARISRTTGTADASWNPGCSGSIWHGIIEGDDLWIVGDWTTTVGGLTRPGMARISLTTGAAVAAFNASVGTSGSQQPQKIAKNGSAIYAIGYSALTIASTLRRYVAKVDAISGALDTGFNAGITATTFSALDVQAYGANVIFGHNGTAGQIIGGATASALTVLDGATGTQVSPNTSFAGNTGYSTQGRQTSVVFGGKCISTGYSLAAAYTGTSIVNAGDRMVVVQLP